MAGATAGHPGLCLPRGSLTPVPWLQGRAPRPLVSFSLLFLSDLARCHGTGRTAAPGRYGGHGGAGAALQPPVDGSAPAHPSHCPLGDSGFTPGASRGVWPQCSGRVSGGVQAAPPGSGTPALPERPCPLLSPAASTLFSMSSTARPPSSSSTEPCCWPKASTPPVPCGKSSGTTRPPSAARASAQR